MIRPERDRRSRRTPAAVSDRLPGMVERSVFLGGSYEVHVRVLGGELLKATVPNDGSPSPFALEEGHAGDALPAAGRAARVLASLASASRRARQERRRTAAGSARRLPCSRRPTGPSRRRRTAASCVPWSGPTRSTSPGHQCVT